MTGMDTYTIAPWLSVRAGREALDFYKRAFGAEEVYLFDGGADGVVARLSIHGAEFWVADEPPETPTGSSIRVILTVPEPDAVFAKACAAGALEVYPVSEDHGWRVGRVVDPYGHHWEIGHQL